MELPRSYTREQALEAYRDLFTETLTRTAKILQRQGIHVTPDEALTVHLALERELKAAFHTGSHDRRTRRREAAL